MTNVIYAILVLGVMGGLFGLLLAVASKVFAVEKDERLEPIIEALPGANCGGCGYSGCAGYAQAVIDGSAPLPPRRGSTRAFTTAPLRQRFLAPAPTIAAMAVWALATV